MAKVTQHLWFDSDMDGALALYTRLLPGSSVDWTSALPADSPSGPAGSVKVVEFTLRGRPFLTINAGPRSIQRLLRHHVRRPG